MEYRTQTELGQERKRQKLVGCTKKWFFMFPKGKTGTMRTSALVHIKQFDLDFLQGISRISVVLDPLLVQSPPRFLWSLTASTEKV